MRIRVLLFFICFFSKALFASTLEFPNLQNPQNIVDLFPKNANEMRAFREESIIQLNTALEMLKERSEEENTFEVTLLGFDQLNSYFVVRYCNAEALALVSPDPELREEALKTAEALETYFNNLYLNDSELYQKIKSCYEENSFNWSPDQIYLAEQFLIDFEKTGQSLAQEEKARLVVLQKQMTQLEQAFQKNIQSDDSHFYASEAELEGLNPKVMGALSKNEEGLYKVGCDYPTVTAVLSTCVLSKTRKKLQEQFLNRAFPQNHEVLSSLIKKRDEVASTLGYPSFAHLSLSNQMAKDPAVALDFLQKLSKNSKVKENLEFKMLTETLPKGVSLTAEGKLNTWDYGFVLEQYKKKYYQLDSEKIAEYFSLDSTFQGLMGIYEQFFNIRIENTPISGLWHEDVTLLSIKEMNGALIGYVILDLFPREGKFSHACNVSGIAKRIDWNGKSLPGLDVVIANFTKPSQDFPSLLKHREVITLFHEFGHALHDLFSKHEYHSFTGMGSFMKRDFVELPSQMLEEWMWDPAILKQVSAHYQTGESLSDTQIEKLVASKNVNSGYFLQRQCAYSFLSLSYFSEGASKDITLIQNQIFAGVLPNYYSNPNTHMYAAFGHLVGYDAAYYGYLFSKVYALDVFSKIKQEGLLNPNVGTRYRKTVLEKGCSKDPNELLIDFLGRSPNQEAFICDLGLEKEVEAPKL